MSFFSSKLLGSKSVTVSTFDAIEVRYTALDFSALLIADCLICSEN